MNIKKIVGALLCSLAVTTAFAQQPYGGCWHPDYIKDWTPEKDPDAKFNRSTVKLQPRIEGDNIKAHQYQFPEGQVAACLTMNPMCSMTPSQGANNFIGYNPTYWQYIDMVIWWGGSAGEGIIVPPSAPVIDACHMNGVKILGNVFFPPQAYSGDPEWVEQMLTKEGNTYPYAEKMYEIAKYYGFDGWFINEETYASTASDWVEWIKYFYQCAEADGNHDMYIQWYDASMYVNNALDIMMANPNTSFFANYGSAGKVTIEQNRSRMENAGVDMDAFFEKLYSGIEQAQGGLTGNAQNLQAYFLEPDNIESALPTEVKFEVSENGTDFDVVNTAAAGTDVSYNLPEARDAKAVAFTIGLGLWMTTPIAELEVYGKDGTAIDEITVSRVLVAPNPVNQGQKMAVAADQAESIEIYSMQGALVKAERAEETITFVSTDDLTPGIYFMVVKGADYTETVKVIVK